MILHLQPIPDIKGTIKAPASKSYSIRAFLIAACGGSSQIIEASDCDDAKVAMRVARSLGCTVKFSGDAWHLRASSDRAQLSRIDVGESGTVLRFLLPLVTLKTNSAVVMGQGTLRGRPNMHLLKALRDQGVDIRGTGPQESVPIVYCGGRLKGGTLMIDGSLSSQFISALLITCPQLPVDTTIVMTGKSLVSRDYILMTQQILKKAGIVVRQKGPRALAIRGPQAFKGLKNFRVPSDYGLAAFFMAAAALLPSAIRLQGSWDDRLVQSDGKIQEFLKVMGVRFSKSAKTLTVRGPFRLKGGVFSLKDCPDLVPVMSVLALFARGRTRLVDIHHARAKESDRISDLRSELLKIGAKVSEKANELIIDPQPQYRSGVLLNPHHDHRLAMAFAVLGLKIGARVKNIECSHKSYPGFVSDLKRLNVSLKMTRA